MEHRHDSSNVRRERYGAEAGRRFQDDSERWLGGKGAEAFDPSADDPRADDAVSIDEVVERLSHDMSNAVNTAPMDERDELRTYATELVREDTAPPGADVRLPTRRARLTFFAVAVWLAVAGVVLSFLVPPAGIVSFFMAGIAAVLAAILGAGEAPPERTT